MTRANRLSTVFVGTDTLDDSTTQELFEFCDRFSTRHRQRFEAQMEKDDTVFIVRGRSTEHLIGFGTISVVEVEHEGAAAIIIYTGRAMIAPEYRKHGIIQRVGLEVFTRERLRHPLRAIYWMMTSATLNSYLLMTRNLAVSYPRAGGSWPTRERAYVEQALAHLKTPWDPDTCIVQNSGDSIFREGQLDANAWDSSDADVAFYAKANPGQASGDQLVCLAPLSAWNFAIIMKRQFFRRREAVSRPPSASIE